jgi:hypothetical protein
VVAVVCLGAAGAYVALGYRPSPRVVSLAGTSEDMGRQAGQAFRLSLKLLARVYVEKVICGNDPARMERARVRGGQQLALWPHMYAAELQAMARSSGVDDRMLAFGNVFLDAGMACRSAVVSRERFLHAHNLDWDNLGGLGRWTVSVIRRAPTDGRFRTVSVGFPGLIGSLDIINEKGLALSFNQLGSGRTASTEPVFVMLRRIAETCETFAQAQREILQAPPGMPFIITVSSANEKKGSVFEREAESVVERALVDGVVGACNRSQGTESGLTDLDDLLRTNAVSDLPALQQILAHPRVLQAHNIYSVVFDFAGNKLHLASGQIPAAGTRYREFSLFN